MSPVMRLAAVWCFVWSVTSTVKMHDLCGCGPHDIDVSIDSPSYNYTVYQLLGRSVNLQLHSPEQFVQYRSHLSTGKSGLQQDEIEGLLANKTFDDQGSRIHVNLMGREYGGIQCSWTVHKCGETTHSKYVTIKIGDAPRIYHIRPQMCEKEVMVCAKATGQPPPLVVIQYMGLDVTSMSPQNSSSQFCSMFIQTNNLKRFSFSIVASNCLGQHTVVFNVTKNDTDGESMCHTMMRSYTAIPKFNSSCMARDSNVSTDTSSTQTPCPTTPPTPNQSTQPDPRKTFAIYLENGKVEFSSDRTSPTTSHNAVSSPSITTNKVSLNATTQIPHSDARTHRQHVDSTMPRVYNSAREREREPHSHSSVSFVAVGMAVFVLTGIILLVTYVWIKIRKAADSEIHENGSKSFEESGVQIEETVVTEGNPPDIVESDKRLSSGSNSASRVIESDSAKVE